MVGKLNTIIKYSMFFGHTSWTWVDGFFNFHPRVCVSGGGAEIQVAPRRKNQRHSKDIKTKDIMLLLQKLTILLQVQSMIKDCNLLIR